LVWEDCQSLSELILKLENGNCGVCSGLEVFFNTHRKINFQKIRKNLEREGLINLHEKYFQDLENKMQIAM
jgi:hypothetical protein